MENNKKTTQTETEKKAPETMEVLNKMMELPLQMNEMMLANAKKMQDATLDYFQAVEKIQRDYLKEANKVWGQMIPGENKIWEAQTKMVEQGFDVMDKMMAAVRK
jgi:uncharacterized protein (DUF1800 family)